MMNKYDGLVVAGVLILTGCGQKGKWISESTFTNVLPFEAKVVNIVDSEAQHLGSPRLLEITVRDTNGNWCDFGGTDVSEKFITFGKTLKTGNTYVFDLSHYSATLKQ